MVVLWEESTICYSGTVSGGTIDQLTYAAPIPSTLLSLQAILFQPLPSWSFID